MSIPKEWNVEVVKAMWFLDYKLHIYWAVSELRKFNIENSYTGDNENRETVWNNDIRRFAFDAIEMTEEAFPVKNVESVVVPALPLLSTVSTVVSFGGDYGRIVGTSANDVAIQYIAASRKNLGWFGITFEHGTEPVEGDLLHLAAMCEMERHSLYNKYGSSQTLEQIEQEAKAETSEIQQQIQPLLDITNANMHSPDFRSIHWEGETYTFTAHQSRVVEILWNAWHQKTPEVSGDYLLENSGSDSKRLRDLFQSGRHPTWGKIIVEGSTKGSYRLK